MCLGLTAPVFVAADNLIHAHWNWNTPHYQTYCACACVCICVWSVFTWFPTEEWHGSSRPPCFIFTVSEGSVFWLRLPFVTVLTMKMPIKERQHCENRSTNTHVPTADRRTRPLFQRAKISPPGVSFFFFLGDLQVTFKQKVEKSKPWWKSRRVFNVVVGLSPGCPNYKWIGTFFPPLTGWEQCRTLKSCSTISWGIRQ